MSGMLRRALLALVLAVTVAGSIPAAAGRVSHGRPPAQPTPPVLGPVRFVPAGSGASVTIQAAFPPVPTACQANQPRPLTASYPGTFEVGRRSNGELYLITELTFSDYLKGIAEVPTSWPMAALEAQVVAARTYAISHMGGGGAQARELNYDLCSTDQCQVYRGLDVQNGPYGRNWAKAVDDTADQILQYQGRPADALYFSTSNGHTYSNADVFGGSPLPYLKAVTESDDTGSSTSSWSLRMPLADIADALRLGGSWNGAGLEAVSQQGDKVALSGGGTSTTLALSTFRNKLNIWALCLTPKRYPTAASSGTLPQVVPSVWMTLRQEGSSVVMTGRGWGHGVGMVQWGAKGKADRGMGYADILAYYYGGLRPVKVTEPGSIRILLATGVQQVTVQPNGPIKVDAGPPGPVTITGGSSMTIASAAPGTITPTLSLSSVTVTATAEPGRPAALTFTLSRAANVGLTYQQSATGVKGEVTATAFPAGDQTLSWDPFAANLPLGSYEVALVADDGVSRVVSSASQVTVQTPPPSPTPSPSPTAAAARPASSSGLPAWWPVALAALVVLVAAALAAVVLTRRKRA